MKPFEILSTQFYSCKEFTEFKLSLRLTPMGQTPVFALIQESGSSVIYRVTARVTPTCAIVGVTLAVAQLKICSKFDIIMQENPIYTHHRRSIRLKGYDYSSVDAYFVMICVQNRECLLGAKDYK